MPANRPFVSSKPDSFVTPEKSAYYFVIWNLYLTDKLTPLVIDQLRLENITKIVAILPEEQDFQDLHVSIGDIPVKVLAYHHNHTPVLPREEYDEVAKEIDVLAKTPGKKQNVLLFCNNGYQRSLPFLVYYMTNFHKDEFPTVEKAARYLLSILRIKDDQMIESIKQLFTSA